MSRGTPSVAALLGMIGIAAYQNRDKISQWLSSVGGAQGGGLLGGPARTGSQPGFDHALETLAYHTGLSHDEIRSRLGSGLPQAAGRTPA